MNNYGKPLRSCVIRNATNDVFMGMCAYDTGTFTFWVVTKCSTLNETAYAVGVMSMEAMDNAVAAAKTSGLLVSGC
jgi:hypothetical protein